LNYKIFIFLSQTERTTKHFFRKKKHCIHIYIYIHTYMYIHTHTHARHILMEPEFSRQIFERYPNIKFNENTSSRIRVVPCAESRSSQTLLAIFRTHIKITHSSYVDLYVLF
jgi:hypothetical protein